MLNDVAKNDCFLLPCVDDTMDMFAEGMWLHNIHMKICYLQSTCTATTKWRQRSPQFSGFGNSQLCPSISTTIWQRSYVSPPYVYPENVPAIPGKMYGTWDMLYHRKDWLPTQRSWRPNYMFHRQGTSTSFRASSFDSPAIGGRHAAWRYDSALRMVGTVPPRRGNSWMTSTWGRCYT